MTSKEMLKAKLPEGHIWENTAPLGSKPNWKIVRQPDTWGMAVYIKPNGEFGRIR